MEFKQKITTLVYKNFVKLVSYVIVTIFKKVKLGAKERKIMCLEIRDSIKGLDVIGQFVL